MSVVSPEEGTLRVEEERATFILRMPVATDDGNAAPPVLTVADYLTTPPMRRSEPRRVCAESRGGQQWEWSVDVSLDGVLHRTVRVTLPDGERLFLHAVSHRGRALTIGLWVVAAALVSIRLYPFAVAFEVAPLLAGLGFLGAFLLPSLKKLVAKVSNLPPRILAWLQLPPMALGSGLVGGALSLLVPLAGIWVHNAAGLPITVPGLDLELGEDSSRWVLLPPASWSADWPVDYTVAEVEGGPWLVTAYDVECADGTWTVFGQGADACHTFEFPKARDSGCERAPEHVENVNGFELAECFGLSIAPSAGESLPQSATATLVAHWPPSELWAPGPRSDAPRVRVVTTGDPPPGLRLTIAGRGVKEGVRALDVRGLREGVSPVLPLPDASRGLDLDVSWGDHTTRVACTWRTSATGVAQVAVVPVVGDAPDLLEGSTDNVTSTVKGVVPDGWVALCLDGDETVDEMRGSGHDWATLLPAALLPPNRGLNLGSAAVRCPDLVEAAWIGPVPHDGCLGTQQDWHCLPAESGPVQTHGSSVAWRPPGSDSWGLQPIRTTCWARYGTEQELGGPCSAPIHDIYGVDAKRTAWLSDPAHPQRRCRCRDVTFCE